MYCTHCHKPSDPVHRWPLFNGSNPLWQRRSALSVPANATRLLAGYAPLWGVEQHQPIQDLLSDLSHHAHTPARPNEGYEINFYSASELVGVCNGVLPTLQQRQHSFDLASSFVVCLKSDSAAMCCLSHFLGIGNSLSNTPVVDEMYANPLAQPSALLQESSTEDLPRVWDPEQYVTAAHPGADKPYYLKPVVQQKTRHNWDEALYTTSKGVKQNPIYSSIPMEPLYYSIPMEPPPSTARTQAWQESAGLFNTLAQSNQYEQFIVVFAHHSVHALHLRITTSYLQRLRNFVWRNTTRRITTVVITSLVIGGIIGTYLGLSSSSSAAAGSSSRADDRNCTYPNGTDTRFAELQDTLATGNSALTIPGLDPATCTLLSMVINNTVSALKIGGYNCWQNVQSALMPLAASALALNSDNIQQIITAVKQYCFPTTTPSTSTSSISTSLTTTTTLSSTSTSTSTLATSTAPTTSTASTTSTTRPSPSTLPCCQFNVCRNPDYFKTCRCTATTWFPPPPRGQCIGNTEACYSC